MPFDLRRIVLRGVCVGTLILSQGFLLPQSVEAVEAKQCRDYQCRLTPPIVVEVAWILRSRLPNDKTLLAELTSSSIDDFPMEHNQAKTWFNRSAIIPEIRELIIDTAEKTLQIKKQSPLIPIDTLKRLAAVIVYENFISTQTSKSEASAKLAELLSLPQADQSKDLPLVKAFSNGLELYADAATTKIVSPEVMSTNVASSNQELFLKAPLGTFTAAPISNDDGLILLSYQAPTVIFHEAKYTIQVHDWVAIWSNDGLVRFFPFNRDQMIEERRLYSLADGTLVMNSNTNTYLLRANGAYKNIPTKDAMVFAASRIPAIVIAEPDRIRVFSSDGARLLSQALSVNLGQEPIVNSDDDFVFNLTLFIHSEETGGPIPKSEMINVSVISPDVGEVQARIE